MAHCADYKEKLCEFTRRFPTKNTENLVGSGVYFLDMRPWFIVRTMYVYVCVCMYVLSGFL